MSARTRVVFEIAKNAGLPIEGVARRHVPADRDANREPGIRSSLRAARHGHRNGSRTMSTDPNPWAALLDALRIIGRTKRWPWGYARGSDEVLDWQCHSCHGKFPDRGDENGQCPATENATCPSAVARRALASWESRPRLREDGAMVDEVIRWEYARNAGAVDGTIGDLLDAIEARLLGAPGKGTT